MKLSIKPTGSAVKGSPLVSRPFPFGKSQITLKAYQGESGATVCTAKLEVSPIVFAVLSAKTAFSKHLAPGSFYLDGHKQNKPLADHLKASGILIRDTSPEAVSLLKPGQGQTWMHAYKINPEFVKS